MNRVRIIQGGVLYRRSLRGFAWLVTAVLDFPLFPILVLGFFIFYLFFYSFETR